MLRKILALTLSLLLLLSFSTGFTLDVGKPETADSNQPMVNVIIQLEQNPVLAYEVELKKHGKFNLRDINTYANQIEQSINTVINKANKLGLDIVTNYQYKYSFAGFSATLPVDQVQELTKIPGVKNVFPDIIIEVPQVVGSVPKTGAPYLWNLPENITGEGMIVAVLDTGIDYNHVLLGGGFGKDYKVMGGYNFTDSGSPLDPIDVQGHGTHVAGTIAGKGFGYDGVAPDANLYAVKVLGDDGRGASSWVIAGIEWAVNPHNGLPRADVINMSLGNSIISPNFPTSLAANQAAEAGVIVVTSAGNSGHDKPTAGSPGTADKVISVGAYGLIEPAILSFSNGTVIDYDIIPAADAPKPDGQEYEIVYAGLGRVEDFEGLDVEGKIALVQRGAITFAAKGANAQANGAVGIIVFNNVSGTFGMAGTFGIPAFAVSLEVGLEILEMMGQEPELKVAMNSLDPMDLMANFSSAGPTSKYTLKPDISAPGVSIVSAYPNNSLASLSGTSMAAPHVAGGVALLKQLRPGLEVEEYKALLMNTPKWLNDMYGNKYPVTVQGSGIMDLEAAAKSRGIAIPGSLSLNVTGETNKIRVKNISNEAVTYNIEFISETLNATFVDQITVEGNSEAVFEVKFDLDVQEGAHEGYIILTPTEPLEKPEEGEEVEEYYDKLQVTVYYYSGDLKEFFVKDLEFRRQFTSSDKIDITFTLLEDAAWVAIVTYDRLGNLIDIPAEAPFGLPKGTWTLHNTDLYLPDGEYVLRLYAVNLKDEIFDLWEPFEIDSNPASIYVDYDPFVNIDKYTLKGELSRDAVLEIDGVVVPICHDLSFEYQVEINEGVNEFTLTTTTSFGAVETVKITIEKVEDLDVFSVAKLLEELQYTGYEEVLVYDYLPPGAVVKVSVNNGPDVKYIADENGLLKYNLTLVKGLNKVRFTENYLNIIYTYEVEIYRKTVDRLAGANRFQTATAISQFGWEKADTVILARADDFADSLAAIPLSKKLNAPILLTNSNKLSDVTREEISRLGASEVIILGGVGAISDDVSLELLNTGLTVRRIGGANRYETAVLIAKEVVEDNEIENAIIVSGRNFPDGLSATMLSNKLNAPILLVNTNIIPECTSAFIENYNVANTYIVGGTAVISEELEDNLPNPKRFAGKDRFATSVQVAKEITSQLVFIANGQSFADSITLATLVAKYDGVLLLVRDNIIPESVKTHLNDIAGDVLHFYIAGGNAVVSEEIEKELLELLKTVKEDK